MNLLKLAEQMERKYTKQHFTLYCPVLINFSDMIVSMKYNAPTLNSASVEALQNEITAEVTVNATR